VDVAPYFRHRQPAGESLVDRECGVIVTSQRPPSPDEAFGDYESNIADDERRDAAGVLRRDLDERDARLVDGRRRVDAAREDV
jgi:hypothetical protein